LPRTSSKSRINQSTNKEQYFTADLEYDEKLSYGINNSGNSIIQGENLNTLEAISKTLKEKVRCIYIDPPYNNQEKYTHYTDGLEHDRWIEEVTERIKILSKLLRPDGSLWISIDDRELHYLKVAADSIMGRKNFLTTIVWQQRTTRENRRVFSNNHEYLLVYAKDFAKFKNTRNLLSLTEDVIKRYNNPDNDPRGPWQSVSANVQAGHATLNQFYTIEAPNGKKHIPPKGRCWAYNKTRMLNEIAENNIWFGLDGNSVPRVKKFLSNSKQGLTPNTLWLADRVGTNKDAKKHMLKLFPDLPVFDTPKPEQLLYRIIHIATDPDDLVLDAYIGSGTTCAVAHKMGRHYIGIEQGKHAVTHCVHRMMQVIDGEPEGISKLVDFTGGGGFDFYRYRKNLKG